MQDVAQSWGCEENAGGTESATKKIHCIFVLNHKHIHTHTYTFRIVKHPTMEKLRKQARDALQRDPRNLPPYLPAAGAAAKNNLYHLWQNVSAYDSSTHLNVSPYEC